MGKRIKQYRYNVGDIIQTDKIHFKVLQQTRIIRPKYKTSMKAYKVSCLKCGYVNEYSQSQILSNCGCGVCNGKIIVNGINSVQDKAPWLIDWLRDSQAAKKYAPTSNVYVEAQCPDCGYIKTIMLNNLYLRHGFKCPICSDGKSFPQRFMTNLFLMYNIDFIPQFSSKDCSWIRRNRYDFFLPQFNAIIEVHGIHHYIQANDFTISGEEQRKIDFKKKQLALQNGIQTYIEIDFSDNTLKTVPIKLEESGLLSIISLSIDDIDWQQVYRRSAQSIIKKVCDYYQRTRDTQVNIGKVFGINHITVGKYLKKGADLGWTTYYIGQRLGKRSALIHYEVFDQNNTLVCMAQSVPVLRKKLIQKYNKPFSESGIYRVINGIYDNYHGFKIKKVKKGEKDYG